MDSVSVIKESFTQYSGAVLQSRALIDVRDCLKPSARQIFYCLYTDKFNHNKPFKKTLKAIGSAARMYIHGDSSCVGVIMRAGQPFAMRYPLIDVSGAFGNQMEAGNWGAPRYTESRLSEISDSMFEDINKNAIQEWRDNYDDTEKYPSVLPTKGFYNIVNGTTGIGVGLASSIPQFNIKDVNTALIHLLKNPNCDFEEIYCEPDFATGGILLNASEVKESLRKGTGASCKLRAVVEYDENENCLIVKEIPYGVYTNTICGELEKIVNGDDNFGIERFNDLTGLSPNIKIYLTKKANPAQVLRKLYKNTSLQSHFGINMTMLDGGRFPKVFSWKEALESHIAHEKEVYKRSFLFDLQKLKDRKHILDGYIIAIDNINRVVDIIKKSSSSIEAAQKLQIEFQLSERQGKAIVELKLGRLANLELNKIKDELAKITSEISRITTILENEEKFNQELINGWQEAIRKFGDDRRTQVMDVEKDEDEEPIEKKQIVVHLTNFNNIYAFEDSSLISQRKGGIGNKIKLSDNEFIIKSITDSNYNNLFLFSSNGKVFSYAINNIPLDKKISVNSLVETEDGEYITSIITNNPKSSKENIVFITKNGIVKRTLFKEYNIKKTKGVIAIKLKENDTIVKVFCLDGNENLAIFTENGSCVIFPVDEIPTSKRNAVGVKGITLRLNDFVADAVVVDKETKEILTVTSRGKVKKTSINEFNIGSRANKGITIHKLEEDNEKLVAAASVSSANEEVIITSKVSCIKFPLDQVNTSGRNTIGTNSIKLKDSNTVTGVIVV